MKICARYTLVGKSGLKPVDIIGEIPRPKGRGYSGLLYPSFEYVCID